MKVLKRILCLILCVVILSGTIGTKYFDANHMEKVEAAAVVIAGGITVATIAEICLFVGTTALAAYGLYEGYENREEIARFGKEFIDNCSNTAEGWVMQFVDAMGQDYVFGSEALELVQDAEWSVIQGGLPPEGDPNKKDDKDKDKFHIPGDPMTHVAQFTALGATWFATNAKNIYQEWCDILDGWQGKDTPIPRNNVLYNNFPQTVSDADIAAQWSGNLYDYRISVNNFIPNYGIIVNTQISNCEHSYPMAGYLSFDALYIVSSDFGGFKCHTVEYCTNGDFNDRGVSSKSSFQYNGTTSISYSVNFPVFATQAAARDYLAGTTPATDALNYAKTFRNADWLQQDWTGSLIDPLVNIGLTLSQLIEIMRQLGLKTLQGLTAEQLLELLKRVLPRILMRIRTSCLGPSSIRIRARNQAQVPEQTQPPERIPTLTQIRV